ncbi:hypothetical protein QOZ80_4AG0311820 [Eleusine coracana subsp. coracana]|nr:hypothetical protein QOZ80_4AG0311820 [Eleusine coracana subsp. coracana]
MDLLSAAYGATSDEDADDSTASGPAGAELALAAPPPSKRPRWEPYLYLPPPLPQAIPQSIPPNEVPQLASLASGKYISKRERALLAASQTPVDSTSQPPPPAAAEFGSPVGSISDSNVRADILHSLRLQSKPGSSKSLPLKLSVSLKGHTKAVNHVDWSSSHAHLLASAGMDHTVHIWNVWDKGNTTACVLKYHTAAVKDVRWSLLGPSLLSGGYDCSLRLVDAAEGKEVKVFKEDQTVEIIKFNPSNPNIFLSGGSKGSLRLWDIRSGLQC